MSKQQILLGYSVGNAAPVEITPSHLIVTGITQLSGKSTTLEALIQRGGSRAVVFKTKIGERGFTEGMIIPPYFVERSDWQYTASLLEATLKERLKFERSWIIEACKNTASLLDVKINIDKKLAEGKLSGLSRSVYTTLQAYLEIILPQIQYSSFSKVLSLSDGINIMDLERFSEEVQSLVIKSVLETVLKEMRDVVVVMPEVWKFLPQGRGNPCKLAADAFIRQGATNHNYLYFDSQDLAGVEKGHLKQVSTWILGLQQERNEVQHTLDQIPLPKKRKPKEDEIMTLPLGHFFVCTPTFTEKVYVRPAWMPAEQAKEIAEGKLSVDSVNAPRVLIPHKIISDSAGMSPNIFPAQEAVTKKELIQLRMDFFDKTKDLNESINGIKQHLFKLEQSRGDYDIDEIVSLVLQKMPTPKMETAQPALSEDVIIRKILEKMPRITEQVVYEVPPLEKIRKDFLLEAKTKIISDIQTLTEEHKKVVKFVESSGKGINQSTLVSKCFFLSATSGGSRQKILNLCKDLDTLEVLRRDGNNSTMYPNLKKRITDLLGQHEATEQEIQQVYNHIVMEILK